MKIEDIIIAPGKGFMGDEYTHEPRIITSEPNHFSFCRFYDKFTAYCSIPKGFHTLIEKSGMFGNKNKELWNYKYQVVCKNVPFFHFMCEEPTKKEADDFFCAMAEGFTETDLLDTFEIKLDPEKIHGKERMSYLHNIQNEKIYEIAKASVESRHWIDNRIFNVIDLVKGEKRHVEIIHTEPEPRFDSEREPVLV